MNYPLPYKISTCISKLFYNDITVQQYKPNTIKNNIYLRYKLFYYWVEVFNEATFLMCKSVETVNTMI